MLPSVERTARRRRIGRLPSLLRRLLGQLVQLARMVYPHVRRKLEVPQSTWTEQERSDLRAIASWLYRCAPYCFPNEAHLRVPDIDLDDVLYLRLDTLKKMRSIHTQPGVIVDPHLVGGRRAAKVRSRLRSGTDESASIRLDNTRPQYRAAEVSRE